MKYKYKIGSLVKLKNKNAELYIHLVTETSEGVRYYGEVLEGPNKGETYGFYEHEIQVPKKRMADGLKLGLEQAARGELKHIKLEKPKKKAAKKKSKK